MQFLQMLVFARWAGPTAAGDFALAATFMGFLAPLSEAGISQAVIQAKNLRQEQLAALAWVSFALGALILFLLGVAANPIARWYSRPDLEGLLPLLGLSMLVTPFGAVQGGLIVRDFRFRLVAQIEVGVYLASFLLLMVLLALGWGVWAMAWSYVLRNSLAALVCWRVTWRDYPVSWLRAGSLRDIWPLLRFGTFDLSARWADFFANYLDKLILGKWLGATALGYYHLAFSLFVLPTARLGYVITRVSYPVFAKVRNNATLLQVYFQQAARDVVLILFPVYLGMALFADELILLLYGPEWLAAAPLLVAFSVAGLVRTLNAVFPQLTKGIGKPQLTTLWMVLWTLALTGFLVFFLYRVPTAESAAWSRVAAKVTVELGLLFVLGRWCGVRFRPVFEYAGWFLLSCIPVVFLVYLVGQLPFGFWHVLILKTIVFLAGLAFLIIWSPWQTDFMRILMIFSGKNYNLDTKEKPPA
ncbi:MAG: oligosaccharide flippase family protein [Lewinellaceae bacterium]|nr:oligosaccharide flippase family protein [Lewinellaceae bacterium]